MSRRHIRPGALSAERTPENPPAPTRVVPLHSRPMVRYEGRLAIRDVEPGAPGDVFVLLDAPTEDGWPPTLDAVFARAYDGFAFGELTGRYRITIEEIGS